ncbi:MAG: SH3 domain-containing protein [Verrucomicrobiota bacterium]
MRIFECLLLAASLISTGSLFGVDYGVVTDPDGYTNLRAEPSAQSEILEKLYAGEIIELENREGDWWRIRSEIGGEGFLYHSRVSRLFAMRSEDGEPINQEMGEASFVAGKIGLNYPAAVKYAKAGRKESMRLLFWLAGLEILDGAAAEVYAYDVTDVLLQTGDAVFSEVLATVPRQGRRNVIEFVEFGLGPERRADFPLTFAQSP